VSKPVKDKDIDGWHKFVICRVVGRFEIDRKSRF
jgi:hypothetical protein